MRSAHVSPVGLFPCPGSHRANLPHTEMLEALAPSVLGVLAKVAVHLVPFLADRTSIAYVLTEVKWFMSRIVGRLLSWHAIYLCR